MGKNNEDDELTTRDEPKTLKDMSWWEKYFTAKGRIMRMAGGRLDNVDFWDKKKKKKR